MLIAITIGLLVIGGAAILVVIGLRDADSQVDPLQERLADYATRGETATLEEIELSQPLTERIIVPAARKFGEFTTRFTPQNAMQNIARKLELAGNPRGMDPTIFLASRFIAAFSILGFLTFIFFIGSIDWTWTRKIMVIGGFSLFGFYLPNLLLQSKIDRRQKAIRKSMPDALDLLTICVEAGLGFDGAMGKVSEKWEDELSLEFGRVLREIQLGKLRREALRDMAERIGIPEMTSFVAAIIQSEQLGVSMAKVLRIQADQMRMKRRQLAEEEAHKAPVKMLFPMVFLIFPALLVILLGPAGIILLQTFGGGNVGI
ncbi:MAG TPA: type II secretion system F family protein [Anaerolineales bacterium]|nr:type II secretion system F family protein [Anaerolineales bacterium]